MPKLYPPTIEGKLPAQAGDTLSIPFIMNRAVNETQLNQRVSCIIKTLQNNNEIATIKNGELRFEADENIYYADFDIVGENKNPFLNIGQFYKIQIALNSDGDEDSEGDNSSAEDIIGYFSSIGVFKYTTVPELTIPELENENYYQSIDITGSYSQANGDKSEKIYSYEFILQDSFGNVISTSGEQLHDSTYDSSISSTEDYWRIDTTLEKDKNYYVIYKAKTINGLVAQSRRFPLVDVDTIDLSLGCELQATSYYDDGYVAIQLVSSLGNKEMSNIKGNYIVFRASSEDNFSSWTEIHRVGFNKYLIDSKHPILLWEDYTVQHGITYKYAIEAYNSLGLHSNKMVSNKVLINFEDIFLFDGERQLKIRFNPKISSFKSTVLETKVDTIGGQYPFIIRNGNVRYGEFQLSGLISLLMDDNGKFISGIIGKDSAVRWQTPSEATEITYKSQTNLTDENIYNERMFRDEVLLWLTNGKPKLFRSSTEGNYLVRLMNVSLTPNDTVGRMLYTFNSTAYEIGDSSFKNLINLGFGSKFINSDINYKFDQIIVNIPTPVSKEDSNIYILKGNGEQVKITEAVPGSKFKLWFQDYTHYNIEIGQTGSYFVPEMSKKVIKIEYLGCSNIEYLKFNGAKITYCYEDSKYIADFDNIVKIEIFDKICQVVEDCEAIEKIYKGNELYEFDYSRLNMEDNIEYKFKYLRVKRKPIVELYYNQKNNKYYLDKNYNNEFSHSVADKTCIYKIYKLDKEQWGTIGNREIVLEVFPGIVASAYLPDVIFLESEPVFNLMLCKNNEKKNTIELNDINYKTVLVPLLSDNNPNITSKIEETRTGLELFEDDLVDIESIEIGNGLIADVCYREKKFFTREDLNK